MKKIVLLSIVCALFSLGAVAQEKPSFFVKAGINLNDLRTSDTPYSYKSQVGFRAGVGSILPINNLIAIQPTLYLSQKRVEEELAGIKSATVNAWYLDLPIDLQFRIHAGNVVLTPAIGPYFAYGVFGKTKNEASGESYNTFKSGVLKKFDCGLNVEFGVEFSNHIMLSVSYQEGITKIADNDAKLYNETANFSVGYKF